MVVTRMSIWMTAPQLILMQSGLKASLKSPKKKNKWQKSLSFLKWRKILCRSLVLWPSLLHRSTYLLRSLSPLLTRPKRRHLRRKERLQRSLILCSPSSNISTKSLRTDPIVSSSLLKSVSRDKSIITQWTMKPYFKTWNLWTATREKQSFNWKPMKPFLIYLKNVKRKNRTWTVMMSWWTLFRQSKLIWRTTKTQRR